MTETSLPVLAPRQKQVAYLVSLGLSNKEIAAELFLSESNITHHISQLFQLLGVRTRSQVSRIIRTYPELLYVSEKPPLCLIAWLKQQRLKAAMALSDVLDRTTDKHLIDDLCKVLELLQPNESNQFEQARKSEK